MPKSNPSITTQASTAKALMPAETTPKLLALTAVP
jgi:hypothetical protein